MKLLKTPGRLHEFLCKMQVHFYLEFSLFSHNLIIVISENNLLICSFLPSIPPFCNLVFLFCPFTPFIGSSNKFSNIPFLLLLCIPHSFPAPIPPSISHSFLPAPSLSRLPSLLPQSQFLVTPPILLFPFPTYFIFPPPPPPPLLSSGPPSLLLLLSRFLFLTLPICTPSIPTTSHPNFSYIYSSYHSLLSDIHHILIYSSPTPTLWKNLLDSEDVIVFFRIFGRNTTLLILEHFIRYICSVFSLVLIGNLFRINERNYFRF